MSTIELQDSPPIGVNGVVKFRNSEQYLQNHSKSEPGKIHSSLFRKYTSSDCEILAGFCLPRNTENSDNVKLITD